MNVVDPEEWDAKYKDLFFGDPALLEMKREREKRVKPAVQGEEGTWAIRRETPAATDMAAAGVKIHGLRSADDEDDESPATGPTFSVDEDGEMTVS